MRLTCNGGFRRIQRSSFLPGSGARSAPSTPSVENFPVPSSLVSRSTKLDLVYRFCGMEVSGYIRVTTWSGLIDGRLNIAPCVPREWKSFTIGYRFGNSIYHIVLNGAGGKGAITASVDGHVGNGDSISRVADRRKHNVKVSFGVQANQLRLAMPTALSNETDRL